MSLPIVRQFVASVEAAALGVKVVKGADSVICKPSLNP